MSAVLLGCAVSLVVSAAIIPLVGRFAQKGRLIDLPGERSSHDRPTARAGGIGIVAGTVAGVAATLLASGVPFKAQWIVAMAVLVAGAGVGFADDLIKLKKRVRLPLYLVCSFAISATASGETSIEVPGAFSIEMDAAGAIVFSSLLIAWYANLFNFMDGIDGIAGCTAVVTMGSFSYLFFSHGEQAWGALAIAAALSSVGFLLYNFPPAKLFMGDAGSVFLGMTAGALTAVSMSMRIVSAAAAVLLMFPFVFDATFTLIRRAARKERFWEAHRTHVYQQMCDLGLSHRTVTLAYAAAATIFAVIGVRFDEMPKNVKPILFWSCVALAIAASTLVLRRNAARAARSR